MSTDPEKQREGGGPPGCWCGKAPAQISPGKEEGATVAVWGLG